MRTVWTESDTFSCIRHIHSSLFSFDCQACRPWHQLAHCARDSDNS